ncbi:MAG: hypothetical protein FJY98_00950 [Candidatus Liptonbacteria bacterium]|nr:hypothetical protein [Candidatus Liptonbacteria bacterium]
MNPQPTTIANDLVWQRWDMLPPDLREALASEKNGELVSQVCEAEHLSEEKYREVARIASWVFLGFLHPEDVANEVKLSTGIHPEIANKIAVTLNSKIFGSLRDELDAVYAPPGTHPEEHAAPTQMEDIQTPDAFEQTLEKLKPESGENSFFKEAPVTLDSLESSPEITPSPSFTPPQDITPPSFDMSFTPPPAPTETPPAPNVPSSSTDATPFILHEEPGAPSLPRVEDFSLNIKPEEFGPSESEAIPVPQANIEIGSEENKETAEQRKTENEERIVHYADLRTPLEPAVPETPLSAIKEPAADEPPPMPHPETSKNDVLNFSNFSNDSEIPPPLPTETPPAPEPISPSKPGFFSRFFGKKKEVLETVSLSEIPPPPAPEAPSTPEKPGDDILDLDSFDEPPVPPK